MLKSDWYHGSHSQFFTQHLWQHCFITAIGIYGVITAQLPSCKTQLCEASTIPERRVAENATSTAAVRTCVVIHYYPRAYSTVCTTNGRRPSHTSDDKHLPPHTISHFSKYLKSILRLAFSTINGRMINTTLHNDSTVACLTLFSFF